MKPFEEQFKHLINDKGQVIINKQIYDYIMLMAYNEGISKSPDTLSKMNKEEMNKYVAVMREMNKNI